jgi:hypothetical protein
MEYRGMQYTVVMGIKGSWKWTVELEAARKKMGEAHSRPAGIKAAECEIDRALAPKKVRLRRTGQ